MSMFACVFHVVMVLLAPIAACDVIPVFDCVMDFSVLQSLLVSDL